MFRFNRDKRIIGLSLILIGLGIILLIPKLSEASNQTSLYTITEASIDFHCGDCIPIQEQLAPNMVQVVLPVATNPCDVCHTDTIDTLDEVVARANALENDLHKSSTVAIVLQGKDYNDAQTQQLEQAVSLLEQAQTALDAGHLDVAEALLNQANNILADVEDTEALGSVWSGLFAPLAVLATGSCSNKCKFMHQLNHLASYSLNKNNSSSSILIFENSFLTTYNPSAMHRRAPPADEDALIITKVYLFWHGRLSHFSARSPFYLPITNSYSFVNCAVVIVQSPFLGSV